MFSPGSGSETRRKSYMRSLSYIHKFFPQTFFFFNGIEVFAGEFKRPCAVKKINKSNAINSVGKNKMHAKCELV